jgi:hypothetical protein
MQETGFEPPKIPLFHLKGEILAARLCDKEKINKNLCHFEHSSVGRNIVVCNDHNSNTGHPQLYIHLKG